MNAVGHEAWTRLRRRAIALDGDRLRSLSPILVIAPHQDDETLGCGGLLAVASALGLRPRVAFLTDGAASHKGSATYTPRRLARTRRREALRALDVLGVPVRDVLFLGWPDARPHPGGAPEYEGAVEGLCAWVRRRPPASVWSPWRGESHCDHEAAAAVARDVASRLPTGPVLMDYLVWGWEEEAHLEVGAPVWALDCPQTIDQRVRALACHRTQTTDLIVDASEAFRIPERLAALTRRPVELYLERA